MCQFMIQLTLNGFCGVYWFRFIDANLWCLLVPVCGNYASIVADEGSHVRFLPFLSSNYGIVFMDLSVFSVHGVVDHSS